MTTNQAAVYKDVEQIIYAVFMIDYVSRETEGTVRSEALKRLNDIIDKRRADLLKRV